MRQIWVVMVILMMAVLGGCNNSQLNDCQLENAELRGKVAGLQTQVEDKDRQIESLKKEIMTIQNEMMGDISAMKKLQEGVAYNMKVELDTKTAQLQKYLKMYESTQVERDNLKGLYENAMKSLQGLSEDNAKLNKQLSECLEANEKKD